MKKITIPPSTELYIGHKLLTLESYVKGRTILIADVAIKELYAVDLAKRLHAELLTIASGEKAKSWETAHNLIDTLFKMGAGRDTTLIALGGGVTTDLVGFVASIYMRGIPLILIPTTLLAIVDAAIGGKTGIDLPYGKNLLGTIYNPQAIFVDLDMLQTLPEKEWFNGLAEILKMALIDEPSIWEMVKKDDIPKQPEDSVFDKELAQILESGGSDIAQGQGASEDSKFAAKTTPSKTRFFRLFRYQNPDLILKAIEGKIAVVEQDPTEQGMRRILNFGHTIGHALEMVTDYAMAHGEAVALGCMIEAHLSMRLGYLERQDFEEIQEVYRRFSLKLPATYDRAQLLSAMTHDKKKALGRLRFVLIDKIGHALPFDGAYCRTVTQSELEPTLDWMEHWKSHP